ncbi:hypothetical protein AB1Y20_018163 [Prymnesium parvum]|uniref:Rab-GAP TBC domain-containing protein n=1 Tax=Prymnesium parvum TaxID=97485 RepID=A0AB34JNU7_PRYPA
MLVLQAAHYLFCTTPGLRNTQARALLGLGKVVASVTGALVVVSSVLALLNPLDVVRAVRNLWLILFGAIMVVIEIPRFEAMPLQRFGFVYSRLGRAMFYLYVGCFVIEEGRPFSFVAGIASLLVGAIELLVGRGVQYNLTVTPPGKQPRPPPGAPKHRPAAAGSIPPATQPPRGPPPGGPPPGAEAPPLWPPPPGASSAPPGRPPQEAPVRPRAVPPPLGNDEILPCWRDEILPCWVERRSDPTVRLRILQGVPAEAQGELWFIALAIPSGYDDAMYEASACRSVELRERLREDVGGAFRRAHPRICGDLLTIDADVPRTAGGAAPEHEACAKAELRGALDPLVAELMRLDLPLDEALRQHVREALQLSEGRSTSLAPVGYVQGLSDVALFLMRWGRLGPRQAWGCVRGFTLRPFLHPLFMLQPDWWAAVGRFHMRQLRDQMPDLAAHLERLALLPEMYLPEWLLPLYTRTLQAPLVALVWNLFLVDGEKFLLHVALAIMRALHDALLECDDLPTLRFTLTETPQGLSPSQFHMAVEETLMPDTPIRNLQDLSRDDPSSLRPQTAIPMLSRMIVDK